MKEISLEELRKIELNLLLQFRDICEKEGFRYSLGGGTLLGAVRHKGFIPWDDDIDVNMPRPDFDRFIEYCKNNKTPFNLVCHQNHEKYWDLAAKIYNPKTILSIKESVSEEYQLGVYIDIFPIDGLGQTYEEARNIFIEAELPKELLVAKNWKFFFRSKTHSWYYEPIRYVMYLLSRKCSARRLINIFEKICYKNNFDKSAFAGCLSGGYRFKEILPITTFKEVKEVNFEGVLVKIYENYDIYLSSLYGDYMKLPPKEKQISHHLFIAYYKD